MKLNIKKLIISITIIALTTAGITFFCLKTFYSYKIKQADTLTAHGDYDKAISTYNQALSIHKSSYLQSKIAKAEALLKKQKEIKVSQNIYKEGLTAFNAKDYLSAYNCFSAVIKEDTNNYNTSIKKLEECKALLASKMISEADEYITYYHDYITAIKCLDAALSIDPDNKKVLNLKSKLYKPYQPKKIVDSDGKQVWKIFIYFDYIDFYGKYTGSGNFKATLTDSNKKLISLIVNQNGDYTVNKPVYVPYQGWYYLEIDITDGSCEYDWE